MFYGHISWDDPEMVFNNKAVKSFDLKAFFTEHYVGNYLPLTMLVHSFGWFLFDNSDAGHHALNILLHLMNGVFVYLLTQRLFKNKTTSGVSAFIFLVHPLQIESVAWIGELKNVLSSTFYLGALLVYTTFTVQNKKSAYWLCLLLFVLGCLSKSSVTVLPLSCFCVDLLVHKRLSMSVLLNKLPFLALSMLFGLINLKTQAADQFINHAHEFPVYQRIGLSGFALINYVVLFLFPINLSVIYPYPELKIQVLALGFLMLTVLITIVVLLVRKKTYDWLFCILFVVLNLGLVLQFIPFGEVLYADRYAYIPLMGFAWMVGMALAKLRSFSEIALAILAVLYAFFSFARVTDWKTAISLYEAIIKKYPQQFIALNSAGVEAMRLNEDRKALDYFNRAVDAAPKNYKAYYNRGLLHLKNKKPTAAIKSFNQTLALYDYQKAYIGRASAYYMSGDIPKAMNDANRAVLFETKNAKAHFVLGNCYNDLNHLDEALIEYNKSIELNGDESDFYFKRAIVYGKKQDFTACLSDLEICLQLNPLNYEAYYWKGVAKVNLKQNPCEDFRVAARRYFEPAINALNKYCQ